MTNAITTTTPEASGALDRLRHALAAAGGGTALLERHLARPRYRPAFTQIAELDGAPVGCALIGHARLRLGAATIETGELDITLLRAEMREELLVALLGACLGALMEAGLPLVTLRGAPAAYAPLGFAPFRFRAATRLTLRADATQAPLPLRKHEAGGPHDDLAALYEEAYQALPLSSIRVAPDWRAWPEPGATVDVLEDSRGRTVAYAVGAAGAVVEAAAADAGAARALLEALAGSGEAGITLALPPEHVVARAALHLGGALHIAAPAAGEPAALAGVVDLPGLLMALAPELEERLVRSRYAGWSGNLRIETEAERVTLALSGGQVEVIDGTRPADLRLRDVTLPALAQLLLGHRAAADLRATGELDCADTALGLVGALFPPLIACE